MGPRLDKRKANGGKADMVAKVWQEARREMSEPNKPMQRSAGSEFHMVIGEAVPRPLIGGVRPSGECMNYEDLNKLRVRISRLITAVGTSEGEGVQHNYSEEGVLNRSKFIGCKSPQELRDELEALAISMWNLKDYIKTQLKALGHDPNDVETYVNGSTYLPLCADIANSAKHGVLTSTRSGKKARLSHVSISHRTGFRVIPSDTPDFDTYYITDDPSQVQYKAPVVDENDAYIGDAADILTLGSQEWESYFNSHPFLLKP